MTQKSKGQIRYRDKWRNAGHQGLQRRNKTRGNDGQEREIWVSFHSIFSLKIVMCKSRSGLNVR